MSIKEFFCEKEVIKATTPANPKLGSYATMLGINKDLRFVLSTNKVANKAEFDSVCRGAETLLKNDIVRLYDEPFYNVPAGLKGNLIGTIGSMTIVSDDEGNLKVIFHKRNSEGFWDDGKSKEYPEKSTTGKFKHEIFFVLYE